MLIKSADNNAKRFGRLQYYREHQGLLVCFWKPQRLTHREEFDDF